MNQMTEVKQSQHIVAPVSKEIISNIVLNGDLSKLSVVQKMDYYYAFCERIGIDPATKPFQILKTGGKESLYCDRSGAAQLNKIYKISHRCVEVKELKDCYVVVMEASDSQHSTVSTGVVSIKGLSGESLANAMMKAETKAKRRSTLDLVGLGILDETEIDTIKGAQVVDIGTEEGFKRDYEELSVLIKGAHSLDELKILWTPSYKKLDGSEKYQGMLLLDKDKRKEELTIMSPVTNKNGPVSSETEECQEAA